VTGSATASNILFTDLQLAAAREAGLATAAALGAQGFGAAAGNMIAPLNLLAGAATVGLVGREDEILRRTLALCLLYALLGGVIVWVFRDMCHKWDDPFEDCGASVSPGGAGSRSHRGFGCGFAAL
jgi:L-lactate permease